MDIESMTAEELRAYALQKEQSKNELLSRYMNKPIQETPTLAPYEKTVEFEGVTYTIDTRRIRSMEFLRLLAKAQEAAKGAADIPLANTLEMFDYAFSGSVEAQVNDAVVAKLGYADFQEVLRIYAALFNSLELKN